jgi:hypothetical protein
LIAPFGLLDRPGCSDWHAATKSQLELAAGLDRGGEFDDFDDLCHGLSGDAGRREAQLVRDIVLGAELQVPGGAVLQAAAVEVGVLRCRPRTNA